MPGPIYKGYSSVTRPGRTTNLYDVALVKQDLLNHFNTRLNERPGRPRWGCIIWELLFDIQDDRTEEMVVRDCERIVRSDPRVTPIAIRPNINRDAGSIIVEIDLLFNETSVMDKLVVQFD